MQFAKVDLIPVLELQQESPVLAQRNRQWQVQSKDYNWDKSLNCIRLSNAHVRFTISYSMRQTTNKHLMTNDIYDNSNSNDSTIFS